MDRGPHCSLIKWYFVSYHGPSAFWSVGFRTGYVNNTGIIFTCSVGAKWALTTYRGERLADLDGPYLKGCFQKTKMTPDFLGYEFNFLPVNNIFWGQIQIDIGWLDALTPHLPHITSGWTSLAAMLTTGGMSHSTRLIPDWSEMSPSLEVITAVVIEDGMMRQGSAAVVDLLSIVLMPPTCCHGISGRPVNRISERSPTPSRVHLVQRPKSVGLWPLAAMSKKLIILHTLSHWQCYCCMRCWRRAI